MTLLNGKSIQFHESNKRTCTLLINMNISALQLRCVKKICYMYTYVSLQLHEDPESQPEGKDLCERDNEEIRLYCEVCGELLCMMCWATDHQV